MRGKAVPVPGFPGRLKRARQASGMTQEQVARCICVDRSTYTKYESGVAEPPLATAYALAHLFGTTLDELAKP